jgi:hypothetical protein
MRSSALASAIALVLLVPLAAPAAAAAPGNDDYADASAIGSLPFDVTLDMSEATLEEGEPLPCENGNGMDESVWYAWTAPTTDALNVAIGGSWGGQTAAVYGPFGSMPADFGSLGSPACVFDAGLGYSLTLDVQVGELYIIQLTAVSSWAITPLLQVWQGPALSNAANDNLADAIVVGGLPFEDWRDLSAATAQDGEAFGCNYYNEGWQTVWYSYTPPADANISLDLDRSDGTAYGAVYDSGDSTGISPAATAGPSCFNSSSGPLRLGVSGGQTYLIQVMVSGWYYGSWPVHLLIEQGPAPLEIGAVVNPIGAVKHVGGVAYVSLSVTCTNPADFWIYAHLRQRLTRTALADAVADGGGTCGPQATTITLAFADDDLAFAPGAAQLSGYIQASDGWTSASLEGSATVKLRNQR